MLCIVLQIHRNILSSQCYIRCFDHSNSFNKIQVECFSSALELSFLKNEEIVKKVKIITPTDFFIPSSPSSDSELSVISGSIVVCQATLTPTMQSTVECSFRLQISGIEKLDPIESKLKVDVKDFFKEQFKNCGHWNLFCASCGVKLPLESVYIKSVREYCESELSEGWFCHGNGTQPMLPPSSQILYLDDTSFYLYTNQNINHKVRMVLDKKCCNDDFQKDDCSNDCNSDSSHVNCASKSDGDRENTDQPIVHGFSEFSTCSSFTSDIDSSHEKQTDSSAESCSHIKCDNILNSTADKDEYLLSSKVLNSAVECQSCGDILTPEKPSYPFLRFYLDKLMFKNSPFNDDHLEYAHNIALLSFWSLVTKGQTSFLPTKLLLQSKVHGEELCLLLWVPSSPVDQFLLKESFEAAPAEIHMQTEPVYKVLYYVGTSLSENVRSWSRDFNVDFYHVSDTMVKTLTNILDASSKYLPEASAAGGFSCGFMRAPSQL